MLNILADALMVAARMDTPVCTLRHPIRDAEPTAALPRRGWMFLAGLRA